MTLSQSARIIIALTLLATLSACATTGSGTPTEKRAAVTEMRQDVLTEIYEQKPDVRSQVNAAPGYGVFLSLIHI